MFFQHRPWATGYSAPFVFDYEEGEVEGWLGGEPTQNTENIPENLWMQVNVIPHFLQIDAYLHMTYNGEKLEPLALYPKPFLAGVSIKSSTNQYAVPQETLLGEKTFAREMEDINLHVIEHEGSISINSQNQPPLLSLGGTWGPQALQQIGIPLPHIGQNGIKQASLRFKTAGHSLSDWIKQGGLTFHIGRKKWVSDNVDESQHPFTRVHFMAN